MCYSFVNCLEFFSGSLESSVCLQYPAVGGGGGGSGDDGGVCSTRD